WEFVPANNGSVHAALQKQTNFNLSQSDSEAWAWLKEARERILLPLEKERQSKTIGKALDAKIEITVPEAQFAVASANQESLRELVNVSALKISKGTTEEIKVSKADGQKCERCWHWETDVGSSPEHPTICARCVEAVKQSGAA